METRPLVIIVPQTRAVTGSCGDGTVQTNEACDDGNTTSGDYCAADCSAVIGSCGDGTTQENELATMGTQPTVIIARIARQSPAVVGIGPYKPTKPVMMETRPLVIIARQIALQSPSRVPHKSANAVQGAVQVPHKFVNAVRVGPYWSTVLGLRLDFWICLVMSWELGSMEV